MSREFINGVAVVAAATDFIGDDSSRGAGGCCHIGSIASG